MADLGGGGEAVGVGAGGAPLFSANTLKGPLNWLKFTKKTTGASPQNPGRPHFSDPGSSTELGHHGVVIRTTSRLVQVGMRL